MKKSRLVVAIGLGLCLGGPAINWLGAPPMSGLGLAVLGTLVAFAGAVWSTVVGIRERNVVDALIATTGAAPAIAMVVLMVLASGYPKINDVSSDRIDPPRFGDETEAPHFELGHYTELVTVISTADLDTTYEIALSTARDEGWEVTSEAPSQHRFEATHTTPVFRFVDDIVVRIRPASQANRPIAEVLGAEEPVATILDARSRSRVGDGDMGRNFLRLRDYFGALGRAFDREGFQGF